MSLSMNIIISAVIGLVLYAVGYMLLRKTEQVTIKDKDYEGELTEIKFSVPRLIIFAVVGAVLTGLAGFAYTINLKFALVTVLFFMLA
nr:hypothetical protein [Eubacterium sp.]